MNAKIISFFGLIFTIVILVSILAFTLFKSVQDIQAESLEDYTRIVKLSLAKLRANTKSEAEAYFQDPNLAITKDARFYVVDEKGNPLESSGRPLNFSEEFLFNLLTGEAIPVIDVEESRLIARVIKAADMNFDKFFVFEKDLTDDLKYKFFYLSLNSEGRVVFNGAEYMAIPEELLSIAKSSWNAASGLATSNDGKKYIMAVSPFLDHMGWMAEGVIVATENRATVISQVKGHFYAIFVMGVLLAVVCFIMVARSRKEKIINVLRVCSLLVIVFGIGMAFVVKNALSNFASVSISRFFDQLAVHLENYVHTQEDFEELVKNINCAVFNKDGQLITSALTIKANLKKDMDKLARADFESLSHTMRGLKVFTTIANDYRIAYLPTRINVITKNSTVISTVLICCISFGLFVLNFMVKNAENRLLLRKTFKAYLFLLPGISMFVLWQLIPIAFSLYLSFHEWTMVDPLKPFVGLQNFLNIFKDDKLLRSLKNTAIFTLNVPIGLALSLGVALLMNRKIKGINLLRLLYFLPSISSFVAISIVWQWIYNPEFGLLNYLLGLIGIPPQKWLSDPKTAMLSIIIMTIWMNLGYQMVIYLAGLKGIPSYLYEVAALDGANRWQQFIHITLPMLKPTNVFLLITSIIGSFQVFTPVYVMTQGGPAGATDVFVYHIYNTAWKSFSMGYASAQSWFLFLLIFVASVIQFRLMGKTFYEE